MNQENGLMLGYHAVCIVDVLGQRAKLNRWSVLPEDGKVTSEFRASVEQTLETVRFVKRHFFQFFKQAEEYRTPTILASFPPEKQAMYHRLKESSISCERFSDTFLFHSPISNTHGDTSVVALYRVLGACCMTMLFSLAKRIPLRGAITIGVGAKFEDDDDKGFYGPALVEAYGLESKIAGHPRIIVSEHVRKLLADGRDYSEDQVANSAMQQLAAACRSLLSQDIDGQWCVDYLGKGVNDTYGNQPDLPTVIGAAFEFARSEAERFKSEAERSNTEEKVKLASRYYLLQQYMEDRLHLWGIDAKGS